MVNKKWECHSEKGVKTKMPRVPPSSLCFLEHSVDGTEAVRATLFWPKLTSDGGQFEPHSHIDCHSGSGHAGFA